MQTLEIAQRPLLQVENDRLRLTARNIIQEMFVRAGEVYREVGAEPASQRLGNRWIFLQNYNIQSHKSPDLERDDGWASTLDYAAGWLGNHNSTDSLSESQAADLPAGRRLFRQRLEWFGLELPVFFQQNLDFSFCLFQLLPAGGRELHAFFKERQRLF